MWFVPRKRGLGLLHRAVAAQVVGFLCRLRVRLPLFALVPEGRPDLPMFVPLTLRAKMPPPVQGGWGLDGNPAPFFPKG